MANTLLEITRQLHEDIERAERLVAKDLKRTTTRYKDRLQQDHRTKRFLESIQNNSRKLIKIYDDEEGVRRAEIERLGGTTQFSTFYERLKDIKDYHRKHPTMETTEAVDEESTLNSQEPLQFTGEEMYGRYLDLHEFYHAFVNISQKPSRGRGSKSHANGSTNEDTGAITDSPGGHDSPTDYGTYVQEFAHFHQLPRSMKYKSAYLEYVEGMLRYLISFHERTIPLQPIMKLLGLVEDDFDAKWRAGEVLGWEDRGEGALPPEVDLVIDPEAFDSAQELLDLGDDKVKAALAARNMKVGGTPLQRAQRLFLCAGKQLHELPANMFVPGSVPALALPEAARMKQLKTARRIANIECKILAVVESLGPVIDDTHAWVEKKLAQNYEELKQDIDRDDFVAGGNNDSDEEEYVYNPLKLPLGVDGKPIPYWLYKLHGLNQEYSCEICGGDVFRGRREYERHFRESKHVNAMHALGIPSSKAFFEVTKVEEALALWENLKNRGAGHWNPETQEEFEDEEGNVYNKKTYMDLKRQGLV